MIYKIVVDKQPFNNPSSDKREYELDIEELRRKGNIADTLVITKDEDYVIRRLELTEYHVLVVLPEPIIEPIDNINLALFQGDNYIYLTDKTGNKFYAEYIFKNEFNDIYVTEVEMNASILITANQITSQVTSVKTVVDNNYLELSNKISELPTEARVSTIEERVGVAQTSADLAISVSQDIKQNGVSQVVTETGFTFNRNGLTIEKTNAETKSLLNEKGLAIKDATGSDDENLLFAGYDDDTGETIVKSKNMIVEKYLTIGTHSRVENHGTGTGVFWIGG